MPQCLKIVISISVNQHCLALLPIMGVVWLYYCVTTQRA